MKYLLEYKIPVWVESHCFFLFYAHHLVIWNENQINKNLDRMYTNYFLCLLNLWLSFELQQGIMVFRYITYSNDC